MIEQPINMNSTGLSIRSAILAAGATILITLVLMALVSLSGGFVSGAETPGARPRISLPIMLHLSTVIPAIPLGAFVLWRKKGDNMHRRLGRIWAVLMLVTAISSFWIGRPGTGIAGSGFSFIHGFAVWTLFSVPYAVYKVRKGNIEAHLRAMQGLYIGLLIAGLFSFIPGRIMGSLVFG
ncbi:MAG: DUF2306 domain-containing protein [Sphingorhabdus sp.]